MRLRQLSRKLNVDTEKLIQYLHVCNLPSDGDSNAKLSEEQEQVLLDKFGPIITEAIQEDVEDTSEVVTIIEEEIPKEEVEEIVLAEEPENEDTSEKHTTTQIEFPEEEQVLPDVIRAPKVELSGLRVVGKIDLPSPKKKEENIEEEEGTNEEKVSQPAPKRERYTDRRSRPQKQPRKQLSPAEQRQREEKIKLRKKRETEELLKQKKRENYLKKVNSKPKVEAQKVINKTKENTPQPQAKKKVGLVTKFFNWVRRE